MAQTDPKAVNRVYEEFEPPYEWVQEYEESDTLILMVKDFKKENLRVQISTNRMLKLSGEQQLSENKWRRFNIELPIPPHSNTNGIKAKFQGGLLYIRLPKIITEARPPTPNLRDDESQKIMPRGNEEGTTQKEPKTREVSQIKNDVNKEMNEPIDGLGYRGEKKVGQMSLYGLVGEHVKQKKLVNLLVVILLLLSMAMHIKNAIKSSFGGSTI
ncbi:hypothetical protein VNO78_21393 [Psophocarpus tetragonolobus]|uniref:SHSP domain-containing protein n=1 Tax=Psophocarpus tetragonolobus TaxID=3891 RepID=A0AAN9SF86_PSOTE